MEFWEVVVSLVVRGIRMQPSGTFKLCSFLVWWLLGAFEGVFTCMLGTDRLPAC